MSLPVEVAMSRGGAGEERYEKIEFQHKVKVAIHSCNALPFIF